MHKSLFYARLGIIVTCLVALSPASGYPSFSPNWTLVEKNFLTQINRKESYPSEKIAIVEVACPYELGKLTALRFIEWSIDNPYGVIGLTSGNTPEYFIKYLEYYKNNWSTDSVKDELKRNGIIADKFPDTSNMKLVQLDAYYPMSPKHTKNVTNYLKRHYVRLLDLKPENILYMDLVNRGIVREKGRKVVFMNGKIDMSLMDREALTQLESWQQQAINEAKEFCKGYDRKIKKWGGIGFYLGTLGYGGHIGFNIPGESFASETHIAKLDYVAAAHSAKDLGGIEHAKGKVAVTVGLGTITMDPNAVMIIIVSGENKAPMVKDAVEKDINVNYPGTIFQKFPNARFYLTSGSASMLDGRATENTKELIKNGWTDELVSDVIIPIALNEKKTIEQLTRADIEKYEKGILLLSTNNQPLSIILKDVKSRLISYIERGFHLGSESNSRILHTAPHHDDIMLGYYPLIDNLIKNNKNHFVYLTSGFNSVSDSYIMSTINRASDWWINKSEDKIFNKSYAQTVKDFDGYYKKNDTNNVSLLETTIALKALVKIYNIKTAEQLKRTIRWLKDDYFPNKNPGDLDISKIQLFKGMIRESEVDKLWSLKNIPLDDITHLRSSFYNGGEFSLTPSIEKDVVPLIEIFDAYKPNLITVADDPQGIRPGTHYRVLQIVAQAIESDKQFDRKDLKIWGYRNVWFRYQIQDANIIVPVSKQMLEEHKKCFLTCFATQKSASFPSPFFDGDFAELTAQTQIQQFKELKTLLGDEYFENHKNASIKNAVGFVLIKEMGVDQFLKRADNLQKFAEEDDLLQKKTVSS